MVRHPLWGGAYWHLYCVVRHPFLGCRCWKVVHNQTYHYQYITMRTTFLSLLSVYKVFVTQTCFTVNHLSFTVVSLQGVCHADLFHCEPPFFHCCLFTGCLSHRPVSLCTAFFLFSIPWLSSGSLWNPWAFLQVWLLWAGAVSMLPGIGTGLQNILLGLWACLTWAVDLCMTDQSYFHCCLLTQGFVRWHVLSGTIFSLLLSVYQGVYHTCLTMNHSFDCCLFTGKLVPLTSCFTINHCLLTICLQGSLSQWHVFPWTIIFLLLSVYRGVCHTGIFYCEPFSFCCHLFTRQFATETCLGVNHLPFTGVFFQGSLWPRPASKDGSVQRLVVTSLVLTS